MGITHAEFDALIQSTFDMWLRVTDSVWDVNIIVYIIGMLMLLYILLLLKITNRISCFDLLYYVLFPICIIILCFDKDCFSLDKSNFKVIMVNKGLDYSARILWCYIL